METTRKKSPGLRRAGLTLIEALVALTVIGVLLAMSVPSVVRTMEQAHADLAGAHLRAIWNAQRYYWLDNRTYADDLATLDASGLLDAAVLSGGRYTYATESSDAGHFLARATRTGSNVWSGQFVLDETGAITGNVQRSGTENPITPGFQ